MVETEYDVCRVPLAMGDVPTDAKDVVPFNLIAHDLALVSVSVDEIVSVEDAKLTWP